MDIEVEGSRRVGKMLKFQVYNSTERERERNGVCERERERDRK